MIELREKRIEQNLSQATVAKKSNISRSHYANIECGKRRPSPEVAQSLGNVLGIDWRVFFIKEDNKCKTT